MIKNLLMRRTIYTQIRTSITDMAYYEKSIPWPTGVCIEKAEEFSSPLNEIWMIACYVVIVILFPHTLTVVNNDYGGPHPHSSGVHRSIGRENYEIIVDRGLHTWISEGVVLHKFPAELLFLPDLGNFESSRCLLEFFWKENKNSLINLLTHQAPSLYCSMVLIFTRTYSSTDNCATIMTYIGARAWWIKNKWQFSSMLTSNFRKKWLG